MDNFGFLKVAAAVPHVRVGDCDFNTERIAAMAEEGCAAGRVEIVAFPELAVTAYTCADLLLQPALLDAADEALCAAGKSHAQTAAGHHRRRPPCATARHSTTAPSFFTQGRVLGVVPKTYIPDYTEFYENRWFRIRRRHLGRDDLRRGAERRLRRGPHVRDQRHGIRRRNLRGPLDRHSAFVAPRAQRRQGDLQPLGVARIGGQARLPASARGPAVGPHPRGIRLLLGRLRRIVDRSGVRRQRHRRRKTAGYSANRDASGSKSSSSWPISTFSGWNSNAAATPRSACTKGRRRTP